MTARTIARTLGAALGAALVVAACGGGASSTAPMTGSASPSTATTATTSAFPVTVEHAYGETELTERPERVVTVGLTDHDAFLAMGVAPVGVTDWYGDHPHAVWPWAQDELGDAEPQIVGNATELDLERIAGLRPDVIVGLYAALTQEQYDTLSQIAPTIAQPGDHVDYGIPWQELTRTVGQVVGEPERADELVAGIEERIEELRREHPQLDGASAAIATPYEGIYVYSGDVANNRLLRALGLRFPDELAELIGEADGTNLSPERVDLLDLEALVWLDAQPDQGPLAQELYRRLPVHQKGREVFVDSASEVGGALSFSSVLSLPLVLDELVPRLAEAVGPDGA